MQRVENDHSSSQLSARRFDLASGPECMGLGPLPVWRGARIMQKNVSRCILRRLVPLGISGPAPAVGNGVVSSLT